MWLKRRYMFLRLFVNTNVYVGSILVCLAAIKNAYNAAMRILEYPGGQARILTYSGPLKTPTPPIMFFHLHLVV